LPPSIGRVAQPSYTGVSRFLLEADNPLSP
jgi:hypothetical protein